MDVVVAEFQGFEGLGVGAFSDPFRLRKLRKVLPDRDRRSLALPSMLRFEDSG